VDTIPLCEEDKVKILSGNAKRPAADVKQGRGQLRLKSQLSWPFRVVMPGKPVVHGRTLARCVGSLFRLATFFLGLGRAFGGRRGLLHLCPRRRCLRFGNRPVPPPPCRPGDGRARKSVLTAMTAGTGSAIVRSNVLFCRRGALDDHGGLDGCSPRGRPWERWSLSLAWAPTAPPTAAV